MKGKKQYFKELKEIALRVVKHNGYKYGHKKIDRWQTIERLAREHYIYSSVVANHIECAIDHLETRK